ncbi:MAG: putative small protein [Actinomycetota bacterium]|nr:putative small protein [Actinomycetota bacterium]
MRASVYSGGTSLSGLSRTSLTCLVSVGTVARQLTRHLEAVVDVTSAAAFFHSAWGRPTISPVTDDGKAPMQPEKADLGAMELSDEELQVLAKVADVIRKTTFGTVLLVIQDGRVVQIEAAEKFRLR